jgi:hypothetical protein
MQTLSYILNEQFENNIFFKEINKNIFLSKFIINIYIPEEIKNICCFYFSRFYCKSYNFKKFLLLKEILDNIFICDDSKNKLIDLFCKLQRTYYIFSKLSYIWKYKRASIKVNEDFSFNPIDENKKNIFVLFQNNSKYLFICNDLINIINSSLSNSPNFFCEPLPIKNPYNNTLLSFSSLYNIYFFMKFKTCNVPILFELYFKSNFDIYIFSYNNECIIRDIKIHNYVNFSDNKTLYNAIMDMLYENSNLMNNIKIDVDFPKERLIKIMRPYLNMYINSKFQISGTEKKMTSHVKLKKLLYKFSKFNPNFGRKILKANVLFGKIIGPSTVTFNDNHINFNISLKYLYCKPGLVDSDETNTIDRSDNDSDTDSDTDNIMPESGDESEVDSVS